MRDPAPLVQGDTPGAVDDRAAEAHPVADQLAPVGVEEQGRRAADPERVVAQLLGTLDRAGHGPRRGAHLVVADEEGLASTGPERGHPVVGAGHGRAVAHDVADLRERDVLEAGGQGEDLVPVLVGDPRQRAIAGAAGAPAVTGAGRRGPGRAGERLEQAAPDGHGGAGGDGAAGQEGSPIER